MKSRPIIMGAETGDVSCRMCGQDRRTEPHTTACLHCARYRRAQDRKEREAFERREKP